MTTVTGKCIKCSKRSQGRSNNVFICRKCKLADESVQKINLLDKISVFDLGWLSGIIEGEGCFYCKTSTSKLNDGVYCYPLSGFAVMSTDKDVMIRLSSLLGLNLRGPYYKETEKIRKVVWSVQITGSKAIVIMQKFYPYLGERRKVQIDEAIAWQSRGKFRVT